MKLKVKLCATTNLRSVPCLQAVIFRHFQQHCLQASSGTRHFVRRSKSITADHGKRNFKSITGKRG